MIGQARVMSFSLESGRATHTSWAVWGRRGFSSTAGLGEGNNRRNGAWGPEG